MILVVSLLVSKLCNWHPRLQVLISVLLRNLGSSRVLGPSQNLTPPINELKKPTLILKYTTPQKTPGHTCTARLGPRSLCYRYCTNVQRCLGADIFTCNSALHVAGISQPKGKKEKDKIYMKRKFNQLVSAGESFILIKRQKNKDKFDIIYITKLTAGSVCQRKTNTTRLGKMSFHFDQLEHCEFIYQ